MGNQNAQACSGCIQACQAPSCWPRHEFTPTRLSPQIEILYGGEVCVYHYAVMSLWFVSPGVASQYVSHMMNLVSPRHDNAQNSGCGYIPLPCPSGFLATTFERTEIFQHSLHHCILHDIAHHLIYNIIIFLNQDFKKVG